MAARIFPPCFKEDPNRAFVESVLKFYEDERTIILSENFESLFNFTKLEEKPSAKLWQALVFTVRDSPVFLAFTSADLNEIKTYVDKLVRSLTSAIHTFSEESIAIATVVIDSGDLSNLKEKIAEATNRLPASRRGMTEAVYDHLMVAVTAAIGLGAYRAGCSEQDKGTLVAHLKSNKGRVRRPFSMLGYVILHLEDVHSPKISSSLPPSILFQTLALTESTVAIYSGQNKELLKTMEEFQWEVVTSLTEEPKKHRHRNVIVVDQESEKTSEVARIPKGSTVMWISNVSFSTELPPTSCVSSQTSEQRQRTEFQWEVVTNLTKEPKKHCQRNVIVVDQESEKTSEVARIPKDSTAMWISKVPPSSPSSTRSLLWLLLPPSGEEEECWRFVKKVARNASNSKINSAILAEKGRLNIRPPKSERVLSSATFSICKLESYIRSIQLACHQFLPLRALPWYL